jgi:hypothetical protein
VQGAEAVPADVPNPFLALHARIAAGEMTHRDLVLYGMLCALVGSGKKPTLNDVGDILGTRNDRNKSARRAVRKLEALGLVRRVNPDGVRMTIDVFLPSGVVP